MILFLMVYLRLYLDRFSPEDAFPALDVSLSALIWTSLTPPAQQIRPPTQRQNFQQCLLQNILFCLPQIRTKNWSLKFLNEGYMRLLFLHLLCLLFLHPLVRAAANAHVDSNFKFRSWLKWGPAVDWLCMLYFLRKKLSWTQWILRWCRRQCLTIRWAYTLKIRNCSQKLKKIAQLRIGPISEPWNSAVAAALSPWTRLFTPIVPRRSLHISFY